MKWHFIPVIALLLVILVLGCVGGNKDSEKQDTQVTKQETNDIPELTEDIETSNIEAPELTEDDIDLGEII